MRRLPVLLAALALAGVACGDDDDEPVATEPPVTDPVTTDAAPETDVPSTDAATTDPPSTDGGSSAGEDPQGPIPTGDSHSPWCIAAAEVESSFDELDVIDFSDPVMLEATYLAALEKVNAAQRVVPPELVQALDTTIAGIDVLVAELDRVDWSFLDVDLSVIDQAEMDAAGDVIDRYNFYVCGIPNGYDPDDTTTTDEPTFDTDSSIREAVIEQLMVTGFTATEANCIAENFDFVAGDFDEASLIALFADCGIPEDRLPLLLGE